MLNLRIGKLVLLKFLQLIPDDLPPFPITIGAEELRIGI